MATSGGASGGAPTSTAYAPAFTTSGTQPALGNGTIAGFFSQVGKLLRVEIEVAFGSTTTFGTGRFQLSMPAGFTAVVRAAPAVAQAVGVAWANAVNVWEFAVVMGVDPNVFEFVPNGVANFAGSAIPFAWASGNTLAMSALVEVQ